MQHEADQQGGLDGPASQTIVLQMPDGSEPDGLYLAQDIAKRSHGALKVTIDSKPTPRSRPPTRRG